MIWPGPRRAAWLVFGVGMAVVATTLVALLPVDAERPHTTRATTWDGWQTVFSETFGSELGAHWTVVDASTTDGGDYVWGTDAFTSTSPGYSAWSVGGGDDGEELIGGADVYPENVDSWLVYGPVDLDGVTDAYVEFMWWLETDAALDGEVQGDGLSAIERTGSPPEEEDWLGWCILPGPDAFDNAHCEYVSGSVHSWTSGLLPLDVDSRTTDDAWIGFHFVSDGDGAAGRGAFLDDIAVRTYRVHRLALPLVLRGLHPEHRVALPLVRKKDRPPATPTPVITPTPEPTGLLENSQFEADWSAGDGTHRAIVFTDDGGAYERNKAGIATPPGWVAWFRHSPGVWEEPRIESISLVEGTHRVRSGRKGLEVSTNYTRHDAGLLQQVPVEPGTTVRLSGWAHAWSNWQAGPHPGDLFWSEGPGYECGFLLEGEAPTDDWRNFTFWLGIDPTGGVDPYADSVTWGDGAHIYNCFREVPSVEVEARSHQVTIFLRSRTAWPYMNNYAYWDEIMLVDLDGDSDPSERGYPVIDRGSRIGVHSILPNRVGDFAEDLAAGGTRFPVVKAVDDLGWLTGIRNTSPETIIVARLSAWELEGCPNVEDPDTDLDEMANALLSLILNKLTKDARMRGVVEYWEVVNEPDPPGPEGYRRLAELMIKCMEKAERYGLRLALFSLNAGTPEWDEMQAMVETGVFARAKEGGHILALHEGTFVTNDPTEGWGQTIPGSPEVDGAGSLNFRYRYLYSLLEQRDEVIPLVVSEWYCGDEASASTQTLVNAVKWYDGEASRDDYFWAACPFTLGPTQGWRHTDYERVYPDLIDYMIDIRGRENGSAAGSSLWRILLRRLGWR